MSDILKVKDPRGVSVYCSENQWERHIINELTGQPIMKDNVEAIIDTIRSPDNIYESHDSDPPLDYREIYSKETKCATYYGYAPHTKVVLSVVGGGGEVVTAYPSKNPIAGTKGEAIYIANNEN